MQRQTHSVTSPLQPQRRNCTAWVIPLQPLSPRMLESRQIKPAEIQRGATVPSTQEAVQFITAGNGEEMKSFARVRKEYSSPPMSPCGSRGSQCTTSTRSQRSEHRTVSRQRSMRRTALVFQNALSQARGERCLRDYINIVTSFCYKYIRAASARIQARINVRPPMGVEAVTHRPSYLLHQVDTARRGVLCEWLFCVAVLCTLSD
jgi:hypothetical protein